MSAYAAGERFVWAISKWTLFMMLALIVSYEGQEHDPAAPAREVCVRLWPCDLGK